MHLDIAAFSVVVNKKCVYHLLFVFYKNENVYFTFNSFIQFKSTIGLLSQIRLLTVSTTVSIHEYIIFANEKKTTTDHDYLLHHNKTTVKSTAAC